MLAKLIVWAEDRDAAIDRMNRALSELAIDGVESSREFHLRVMRDDEFRRGAIHIQWLEQRLPSLLNVTPDEPHLELAAIAGALLAAGDRASPRAAAAAGPEPTTTSTDAWKRASRVDGLR